MKSLHVCLFKLLYFPVITTKTYLVENTTATTDKQWYKCGAIGHIACDCRTRRTESGGKRWNYENDSRDSNREGGTTKLVSASTGDGNDSGQNATNCFHPFLYPKTSDGKDKVRQCR